MFRNLAFKAKMRRPKPEDVLKRWRVVKGDTVQVMAGRDVGKRGVILHVQRDRNRVIVQGLNLVKKQAKQSARSRGGIITKESSIHVSRVALIDPSSNKPTKIRWGFLPAGQKGVGEMSPKGKVRISKSSGAIIPRPVHAPRSRPKPSAKDTTAEDALRMTLNESDPALPISKNRQRRLKQKQAELEAGLPEGALHQSKNNEADPLARQPPVD